MSLAGAFVQSVSFIQLISEMQPREGCKSQKMSMGQVAVSWVLNKKGDSYTIHPSSGNLTVSRAAITATIISSPDLNIVLDHIGA